MLLIRESVPNIKDYLEVDYHLVSKTNLYDAALNLAIGQSVGNPLVRVEGETDELFENHSCVVIGNQKELGRINRGIVRILFPIKNFNIKSDGINHLLVQLMGGQMDIDNIEECTLLNIKDHQKVTGELLGPKYGLTGIRKFCQLPDDQVILGGIIKPKIGLSPLQHLEIVKKFVDGGCNFIKEDEILGDQYWNPLEERVELVANYISKTNAKTFYCVAISSDPDQLLRKATTVYNLGGNGIHVNFHCSLGSYRALRSLDLPLLMHYQKSGDKVLTETSHKYSISDRVLFKLAGLSGCDTLHVGMIGGYMDNETGPLKRIINELRSNNSVPALSCGMHPGVVSYIKDVIGHGDWMANVGAALTGHPSGTSAGVKAMTQAITNNHREEYRIAIEKWGEKTVD